MGKMVSTKVGVKGMAELSAPKSDSDKPCYSWGTLITLESEILDKLGISPADVKVGQELRVVASGKVTSVSQRSDEGSDSSSVSVQFVEIGVDMKKSPDDEFDTAWDESQQEG